MNPETVASLEALLFASDTPLPLERVAEVLDLPVEETRQAVDELRAACAEPGRGVVLVEVGGGIRLVTRPELAPVLLRLQRLRVRSRTSRAAIETLVIIAYRQPISRGEIEHLRGGGGERAHAPARAATGARGGSQGGPGTTAPLRDDARVPGALRSPGPRRPPSVRPPRGASGPREWKWDDRRGRRERGQRRAAHPG